MMQCGKVSCLTGVRLLHMPAMVTMRPLWFTGLANIGFDGKPLPSGGKFGMPHLHAESQLQEHLQMPLSGGAGCPVVGAVSSADGSAQLPPGHPALPTERQMSSIPNGVLNGHRFVQRPIRWQRFVTASLAAVCSHARCVPWRMLVCAHQLPGCHPPQAPMKHRNIRAARTTGGCTPRSSSSTTPCGARAGLQTRGT
jgi:hypothetical protein